MVALFYLPAHRAAGVLFLVAGITDSLDGWVARRTGQVSPLGTFLDPVADKLMVATALVLIVSRDHEWYLALAAAVIIGREIAISALREWMAEIGARKKVAVSSLGKIKTVAQILGIAALLYREDLMGLPVYQTGLGLSALAAVLTLWSMVLYLRAAWPDLSRAGNS